MRRGFLQRLLGFHAAALAAPAPASAAASAPKRKILIKSAWGSADPTQA